MSTIETQPRFKAAEALQAIELIETALMTSSLEELAGGVLSGVAKIMRSPSVLLYIVDSLLATSHFFQFGFQPEAAAEAARVCADQFDAVSSRPDMQLISVLDPSTKKKTSNLVLCPLCVRDRCVGLMGMTVEAGATPGFSDVLEELLRLLARIISRLVEHAEFEKQLAHLNAYLTVSSTLTQPLDLHELLEIALYSCMEVVSAEAASVLLLDDEKENFYFYQAEGPAKPVLMSATFPADRGVAGHILQSQQSEIINDVPSDPRFYKRVDSKTGFLTRNMIALPLTAGEERVGVLEVLNKTDGQHFTEEEHLLLVSVADEIAFAVRNAIVFEYVVNTYCLQRQGETSCRGCRRPLGSWTPCVRYREASI
jgi:transcriptional regulator with GAF, ATPase, and Fis domain